MYDELTGQVNLIGGGPGAEFFARTMQGVRNLLYSSLLGAAGITAAPTDPVLLDAFARFNGLPEAKVMMKWLDSYNPASKASRQAAARLGLATHTFSAEIIQRFGEDFGAWLGVTRKLANLTIKYNGLEAITNAGQSAIRQGISSLLGSFMTDHAKLTFEEIKAQEHRF